MLEASTTNDRRALLVALRRTKVLRVVPALSSQQLSNKSELHVFARREGLAVHDEGDRCVLTCRQGGQARHSAPVYL